MKNLRFDSLNVKNEIMPCFNIFLISRFKSCFKFFSTKYIKVSKPFQLHKKTIDCRRLRTRLHKLKIFFASNFKKFWTQKKVIKIY